MTSEDKLYVGFLEKFTIYRILKNENHTLYEKQKIIYFNKMVIQHNLQIQPVSHLLVIT